MEKQASYRITLSSKGLLTLPISLRKKYNLEKGSELEVIDEGGKLIVIPRSKASDLFGIAKGMDQAIHEMIEELDTEHRENTRNE